MSVEVRIRNGLAPSGGLGGASEGDIRGVASDIINNTGVVDLIGGHLLVHEAAVPAMSIVVDEGVGYIPNDSFDEFDSDSVKFWEAVVAGTTGSRTLAISANSSGQTRIDLVCVKLDPGEEPDYYASDVAELIIVEGTPGAGAPDVPAYHLKLAEVTVVNGATEIEDADIADSRVQITIKDEMLALVKADVGLGNVDNTSDNTKNSATATLTNKTIIPKVVALADGATPALNAALGNTFVLTAAGNRTIGIPTNPVDGQQIKILHIASGGARTLALNSGAGGFKFGTDVTALSQTASGKMDIINCYYDSTIGYWLVVGYMKGF